jgi:hypothetical protein
MEKLRAEMAALRETIPPSSAPKTQQG